MESPEEAVAGLEEKDPLAVAGAVRRCGDRLRAGAWDPGELPGLVDRLALLARDPSPRVRQSVAEAAPYLPEGAFQAIIPPLAKDRSPYVRDAAERAIRRRSTLRRAAAGGEEHDARVERWYREIEKKGARDVARRIAEHETEYFVRRMYHEASSSFLGFRGTVKKLKDAIDAPAIDRGELRALVDRLEERFGFFAHLLETGRDHARPVEPDIRPADLGELLADEAALLRARFPDRSARIEVDLSGVERPLAIDADAAFLRQAFGNILRNAVEAYDADAAGPIRIVVTAGAPPGATDAVITIRDFGAGMHARDVARAFVPFGSSKPGGTGFGLYIARGVARAVHGGDLALESALGQGTTVTMRLPTGHERGRKRR